MTRILACLSLLFFLVPVTYVRGPAPQKNDSQYVALQPIAFDSSDPKRTRTGRLEFLAGWKLISDNPDLGGISSMLALAENRFFLLSDAGVLIGFTLDEEENLAVRPFIAPLPDGPSPKNEYARKNWDAESLIHDPTTGQYWVGYEHQHSVWRYGPSFARKEASHLADAMQKWPENGGAEAMLRVLDKDSGNARYLIFSEAAPYSKGGYQALIFDGDPAEPETKSARFGYKPPKGYKITDAALLPDGRALLLNRRFTPLEGASAILSIGELSDIAPGEVWTSKQIGSLKSPVKVDNMEALAVTVEKSGEREDIIIWVASDDNFSPLQESILLKFRLSKGKPKRNVKQPSGKNEKAEASPGFSSF